MFWRDVGCGGGGYMCGEDTMIGGEQHGRIGEDTMAELSEVRVSIFQYPRLRKQRGVGPLPSTPIHLSVLFAEASAAFPLT